MKLKLKLSIIVIAILAAVVAGISTILLRRAAAEIIEVNIESIQRLASQQAEYWKGREESYIRIIRTLANIMGDFEEMPAEDRRSTYNNMLYGTLTSEPNLHSIYTVWLPDVVDGMDDVYAGALGYTPSGQYAINYTRETGDITYRVTSDVEGSVAYITGPDNKIPRIEDPILREIEGEEHYLVRMMVPIINARNGETVGGVGILFITDPIQAGVEAAIQADDDISAMAV
jgi:methyl-accepting chemotaxis protein